MKNYFSFAIILLTLFCRNVYAIDYSIVVNCGSTGTRLHLYKVDGTTIQDIFFKSTTPGLATFADSPTLGAESLKPLFDEAVKVVDPHLVSVEVLGTAGMRELKETEQHALYKAITTALNPYAFKSTYIKTISGKWEGIYSWLAINYLLNNFQNKTPTTGAVDIGGASTQITFEMPKPIKHDTTDLTINDKTYHIFTKSFLGLGINEARNRIALQPDARYCTPEEFNLLICQHLYDDLIKQHHVSEQLAPVLNEIPKQSFIAHSSAIETLALSSSVYVNYLLYNVYHLTADNLNLEETINGIKIDWTLGAVLYDSIF